MKRIIELSENDYKAIIEDGVQNHIALTNTVIVYSVPYEEAPQGCSDCKRYDSPYFEIKIDKEQLQELVDKAKAEVLASIERPQSEWGKWIIAEIQCPNCFEYFETDCYSTEELNECPSCGADMRKGGLE